MRRNYFLIVIKCFKSYGARLKLRVKRQKLQVLFALERNLPTKMTTLTQLWNKYLYIAYKSCKLYCTFISISRKGFGPRK